MSASWLLAEGSERGRRPVVCAPVVVLVAVLVAVRPGFFSGRRRGWPCWARLLGGPVGGGPPARSPHASLRLGVIDLEARPGLAAAHGRRSLDQQSLGALQTAGASGAAGVSG